jgi:FkbM family methyltransferase
MRYNRFLRWAAGIVGVVGRAVGLSSVPLLRNLYLGVVRLALPDNDVWVTADEQAILLPSPRRNVLSRMVYLYGDWEGPVTRVLCREIRPGMTAVDVGAHIGYYTLIMAKRVGRNGRVYSFEPNPEVQEYLRRNLARNGYGQVAICTMALFREDGSGVLEGRDSLNAALSPRQSPTEGAVPMAVYDRIAGPLGIGKVDLVKMDVEGAEMDILLGMRELLTRDHPSLVIEVHTQLLKRFGHSETELRAYLETFGYAFQDILQQIETTTIFCTAKIAGE